MRMLFEQKVAKVAKNSKGDGVRFFTFFSRSVRRAFMGRWEGRRMETNRIRLLSSREWIAYFRKNALSVTSEDFKPGADRIMPTEVRRALAGSLPAWQLGETSDGRHLRAAARQFALAHGDAEFLEAVDLFIKEEQRHGAALGDWLDRVGIPRKSRDLGDGLFRACRYAIPNYAVWASVVVMVESMAEIYYAAVRRITHCPRLRADCDRILREEVRHIQFQCEHLAVTRRGLSPWIRRGIGLVEMAFYLMVCGAVWVGHGRVMRLAGLSGREFWGVAMGKFRFAQRLIERGVGDSGVGGRAEVRVGVDRR